MRTKTDRAQGALIMVMAMTLVLFSLGAVLVRTTAASDSSVQNNLVQRYSYRALEAGENTYVNLVNANPDAVNCSSAMWGDSAYPNCQIVHYDFWLPVPNITTGNGASPESYLIGNPQPQTDPTTKVVTAVQVQVVGVAGSPGHYVYTSSTVNLQPQNGFLNSVWWTAYQSFDGQINVGTGDYTACPYYWLNNAYKVTAKCTPQPFTAATNINGPIYSNDSIYVDDPNNVRVPFGNNPVVTADPKCQFVSLPGSAPNESVPTACNGAYPDYVASYDAKDSSIGHPIETLPLNNQQQALAGATAGCLYSGPTTITMTVVGGVEKMMITSPDTPGYPNAYTGSGAGKSNPNVCQTNGIAATSIPSNGVIYVQTAAVGSTGPNPFDGGVGSPPSPPQTVVHGCPGCYYGQSNTPDAEADAFVSGDLSGQLTIAAQNDIVIDGSITYHDCPSAVPGTPASPVLCPYNAAPTPNDSLGLIADNYVEVNHPNARNGNFLPILLCSVANLILLPALCYPTGTGTSTGSLTIDAAIVALNESFVVNNYKTASANGTYEGTLNLYGSIAQNGAGPIATYNNNGTVKTGYAGNYLWDPRLALFAPPGYPQPGTTAFDLGPSSTAIFVTPPSCLAPWPNPTSTPPVTCGYHP